MIADLDETIRQLMLSELPVKNGEIDISFDQPKREWSARLSRPTINFFLYDVRENVTLRQHQWERLPNGNGGGIARLKRTPFRVDCTYMLTTWASEADDEHRLLSRSLMTLFRFPVIPDERLIGTLRNPPFEIQARLAAHDRLTNPAEIWSSLDNEVRPSISYIITLALDPWKEISGPIVRSLTLRTGQAASLPRHWELLPDSQPQERVFIAGAVRKKADNHPPVPGIQVAVKGTGLFDTTDEAGHYTLGSLPPGKYTLVAWPPEGKPIEKTVSIPFTGGDAKDGYDFEIT